MIASAISSQKSRRPALRSRWMFRWAPTVTPISASAKWVSGWRRCTDSVSNTKSTEGPSSITGHDLTGHGGQAQTLRQAAERHADHEDRGERQEGIGPGQPCHGRT